MSDHQYECSCKLQTHTEYIFQSPRLIFMTSQLDSQSQFFLAYFSRRGRRVTLITPPMIVRRSIEQKLRSRFPGEIVSNDGGGNQIIDVIDVKSPPQGISQGKP